MSTILQTLKFAKPQVNITLVSTAFKLTPSPWWTVITLVNRFSTVVKSAYVLTCVYSGGPKNRGLVVHNW